MIKRIKIPGSRDSSGAGRVIWFIFWLGFSNVGHSGASPCRLSGQANGRYQQLTISLKQLANNLPLLVYVVKKLAAVLCYEYEVLYTNTVAAWDINARLD